MRTGESTMTTKGQVTIPAEIRTELGLKPSDRVRFDLRDGVLTIAPATSRIRRHFGSVTPRNRPEDWRGIRDEAEELAAADVVAEDS